MHQPSTFAAMEGAFETQKGAPLVILGNPDTEKRKLDSSLAMPHFLSFLTSRRWDSTITGLNRRAASAREKPAFRSLDHCIGVRTPRRSPRYTLSPMPISSP